jgi:hypothetical protein
MPDYERGGVSYAEFADLREIVLSDRVEFRTEIAVLKRTLGDPHAGIALPVWMQVAVGLGFPVFGTLVTLYLAGIVR